jgi:hypothetical protein
MTWAGAGKVRCSFDSEITLQEWRSRGKAKNALKSPFGGPRDPAPCHGAGNRWSEAPRPQGGELHFYRELGMPVAEIARQVGVATAGVAMALKEINTKR